MKAFSVVVLHYNAPVFLEGALDSLQRAIAGMDAEIIVADNASTDFDAAYFRARFPDVKFLLFSTNYGFARGNNLAVREARGEYVFLVNPDVLVPGDLFARLLPKMQKAEDLGLAGIRLIDGRGRFLPESKRRVPGFLSVLDRLGQRGGGRYYDTRLADTADGPTEVLVGAFMGFRQADFLRIGGFDERFFMYGEDIDLSYRFLRTGKRNYYFGSLAALHFKGESTPRNALYRKHFIDASVKFYRKHGSKALAPVVSLGKPLLHLWYKWRKQRSLPPGAPERYIYTGIDRKMWARLQRVFPAVEMERTRPVDTSALYIWDPAATAYEQMLDFMWQHRRQDYYYRFITPSRRHLYGSDSPDGRGQLIELPTD